MARKADTMAATSRADESGALKPQQRFDYSAIVDRPKLKLPKGVRLIVWPVVNIEEWSIERPMPRGVSNAPGGQASIPDTQNWGWHEYGMRVGFWRLAESLAKHRIRPTLSINAKVCETRPRVAQAALDAGWEFMAHCYEQMPIQAVADQPAMMRQTIASSLRPSIRAAWIRSSGSCLKNWRIRKMPNTEIAEGMIRAA